MGVRRVVGLAVAAIGMAACTTWARTFSAPTQSAPIDAYHCARAKVKALGYTTYTFNESEQAFEARDVNDSASKMLPGEQKRVDKLFVKVAEGGHDGTGTLQVKAVTVVRKFSRTGWVEQGGPTSAEAMDAAKAVVAACSGPDAGAQADSQR